MEAIIHTMGLREADRALGVRTGTVAAAVRRGEIKAVRKPGGKRCRVTDEALKEWVREYWAKG